MERAEWSWVSEALVRTEADLERRERQIERARDALENFPDQGGDPVERALSILSEDVSMVPVGTDSERADSEVGASYHDRRLERRLQDPEFREGFERAKREIASEASAETQDSEGSA